MTKFWTFHAPKQMAGGLYAFSPFFRPETQTALPPYKIGKTVNYGNRFPTFLTCYPNGIRIIAYLSIDNMAQLRKFFKTGKVKQFDVPLMDRLLADMETDAFKFIKKKKARLKCASYSNVKLARKCEFVNTSYSDIVQSFMKVLAKYNGYELRNHDDETTHVRLRLILFTKKATDIPTDVLDDKAGMAISKGTHGFKVGTAPVTNKGYYQKKKAGLVTKLTVFSSPDKKKGKKKKVSDTPDPAKFKKGKPDSGGSSGKKKKSKSKKTKKTVKTKLLFGGAARLWSG